MAESFDPYHKWLGIPPAHQPPTHYRLLGIEQFEMDRDVIDAAANQRMLYLQDLAGGQYIKESQKLLNEVATARRCLLNAESKTQYDAALRSLVAPPPPTARVAAVVVPPIAMPVIPTAAPIASPVLTRPQSPVAQPIPDAPSPELNMFDAITHAEPEQAAASPPAVPATPKRVPFVMPSGKRLQLLVSGLSVIVFIAIAIVLGPSLFKPKVKPPKLVKVMIRWPLNEREGAEMFVNDDEKAIPKAETFPVSLPAGKYRFVFKRSGCLDLEKKLTVKPDGQPRVDATMWLRNADARATSAGDETPKSKPVSTTKPKK